MKRLLFVLALLVGFPMASYADNAEIVRTIQEIEKLTVKLYKYSEQDILRARASIAPLYNREFDCSMVGLSYLLKQKNIKEPRDAARPGSAQSGHQYFSEYYDATYAKDCYLKHSKQLENLPAKELADRMLQFYRQQAQATMIDGLVQFLSYLPVQARESYGDLLPVK